jgi:peptidoglycan pentaglycine glycine transferase (the first glycine)
LGFQGRLIDISEKDYFNKFIASSVKGHVLQTWEWGELKAKTGWQPLRLMVEEEGQPVAAVSILKRSVPILKKNIFYAPRGPVLDISHPGLFSFLLEEIKKLARKHQAIFLKIDPDIPAKDPLWHEALKREGFRGVEKGEGFEGIQPKYVFRLDISPDEEQLMKNFHQKTRYNIRLAERKGVKIINNGTREDLTVFYRVLQETCARDRFLVRSFQYFADLYDLLTPPGFTRLFLAKFEDKVIAGAILLKIGDKAWYLYGASSNEARNTMPNYLMQWEMIKWAKSQGCTLYDFRGVSGDLSEDNPLYGLYRFKKGFSGEFTEFIGEYDLIFQPAVYWLYQVLEPVYYKGVRKLISLRKKFK